MREYCWPDNIVTQHNRNYRRDTVLAEGADLSIAAELIDEDYLRRHVPRVVMVLAGELTYIKGGSCCPIDVHAHFWDI